MATKKKTKTTEKVFFTDINELSDFAHRIGEELDNPPVTLDRGSYVQGALSFGSLILDLLTGGGLPPGKFANVYGPAGSGKSTCVGHVIANAIEAKVPVFFFDHETSSDAKYFRALGVRLRLADGSRNPYFHYYQPDTAQQSYRTMAKILRVLPNYTPSLDGGRPFPSALFVIDSIASMLPEAIEEDDESVRMGASAQVHSTFMPLIKSKLGRKNVSLFATNQTRLRPGVMYGNPEYEPGGQAIEFYPDLKIRLQAVKQMFVERNRAMRFVNISTKKNKQFPPFLECKEQLTVAFGRGYERGRDGKGYLTLTGQIAKDGNRNRIQLVTDEDYSWNNQPYYADDLMKVMCSNEFRIACRKQLESDVAYNLFFKANDWASLNEEYDAEAHEDDENPLELAEVSNEDFEKALAGEEILAPKKRGRKKKKEVVLEGEDVAEMDFS